MTPIVFVALAHISYDNSPGADAPIVVAEECGHRLVSDSDLDLGRSLLVVQDMNTGQVLFTVEVEPWDSMEDRASTLDLCSYLG